MNDALRTGSVAAAGRARLRVRATCLAERIEAPDGEVRRPGVRRPVLAPFGENGWTVVFRYGAVVTFGIGDAEEAGFLENLHPRLVDPLATPEVEEALVVVTAGEEGTGAEGILLADLSAGRLLVVAEAMARSAVLAYHEQAMTHAFDRMEPLAERLRSGRKPRTGERALLEQLGEALLAQTRTVGRVEVVEKPEVLWDRPELDRLWDRLALEYELEERERALSRKLALISSVTGTLFDLVQERQVLRVEWYIVLLILFEIVLTLWQMWWR